MWFHKRISLVICVLFLMWNSVDSAKNKNKGGKYNLKFLRNHRGIGNNGRRNTNSSHGGLWPSVFNLATKAVISVNATCGSHGREEFCRLSENGKGRCGICDSYSSDLNKRHLINFAIDGSNRWWQSPPLSYGPEFEYVTVTVDLKQMYQIAYVILKSATSPRPGAWILEKSLDGQRFEPWQYFGRTDKECTDRFGIPATKGKPHYFTDSEVICTSFFSKLTPLENGEIHTSLIQGRPGASETSPELLEFTKARYVRFRFMGHRGNMEPLPKWLSQDEWKDKKLFYSIKDISIGGQCVCNGHAENCRHNVASGHPECECQHHTCGANCEKCCPLYNQRQWYPGSSRDAQRCVQCNCHGHAISCRYDEEVDRTGRSMSINGSYEGGGVCENCTDYTTGVNCEKCLTGYFRPAGVPPDDPKPCVKCECNVIGSSEEMCIQYGVSAGTCLCRTGYTGTKCDSCAPAFRGYPTCESCPCDPKGVVTLNDCEGECICKNNVEGKFCDKCKPGYFGMSYEHPDGCLSCFCSGVTTLCELALIKSQMIQTNQGWLITDLKVSSFITPVTSSTSVFSVGTYELPGVENLYWSAPSDYLGNKLETYGSSFVFNVQWVVMRGDTSGEPTIGPNMVIVGQNGLQIGYGDDTYSSQKMSFQLPLHEQGWYIIPNDIKDITIRLEETNYKKGAPTREQFLSVLINIKHILLRGTFHTDQIEALLESATMSFGNEEFNYERGSVEKCSCPSGYTGLSCESCSFGYVRILGENQESYCGKCDCNGHSQTCNASTGECFCEHNTVGEKCERCAVGFYGNPLRGTPEDCKKCACPLETAENNFSPSCQLDDFNLNNEGGYVCTQCPKGYTGDHCEICDDRYYGDPLEVGNQCKPCDCNGGPCDRKSGQCLACKGNTEGWKCEKCKPDHYGDPTTSNCKSCECDPIGSESKQCHNTTGQCTCKAKFVGRTCDQCETGYGNVTALCPPCACNSIGSKSGLCDGHTGICQCQPGVDGFRCDACQNLHWGFSADGCQGYAQAQIIIQSPDATKFPTTKPNVTRACNCDPNGSKYSSCDPTTGNCICKAHYQGRTCDACRPGYWKTLKKDCIKCHCNEYGASDSICDQETGQCTCKPGITGQNCDQCLLNYYGTVETGCIECEPCHKKGHVCGKGGKCVCPIFTIGKECEKCTLNAWGFEPLKGCKACNCSHTGSSGLQCDKNIGLCPCKLGYKGNKCDSCAFGYYGYPNCRKCLCSAIGTLETDCRNDDCQCNEDGSCNCKENVEGSKCNTCKAGTFGLSKENPKGCKQCFCFGRSNRCVDTKYNWDKIRYEKFENGILSNEPISSDTISLPRQFTGDLSTSYDGYLSVSGTGGRFSVFLTGNGISLQSDISMNELRLNEKFWGVTSGNLIHTCHIQLSRECLLLVLQNVTSVVIQGQDMEIGEVLLDSAKPYIPYNRTSHSIEKCDCPSEYAGLSCQDPNQGYYRYFPNEFDITPTPWIDAIIGIAKPCDCNGRSMECDADTGHCKNCLNNTAGVHCELCATGFYTNLSGNCQPCLCPSEVDNNAESCVAKKSNFVCHCKKGYTGAKCENCKDSYFQDPDTKKCTPCNCNHYGSYSSLCSTLGKCECKPGFHGDKCNQCKNLREYIRDGVCTPCDECTQLLFNDIERLGKSLESIGDLFKDGLSPPWKTLDALKAKYKLLNKTFHYKYDRASQILKTGNIGELEDRVYNMDDKVHALNNTIDNHMKSIDAHVANITNFQKELKNLQNMLNDLIKDLRDFGKKHINVEGAVAQANEILKYIEKNHVQRINEAEAYNQPFYDYCDKIERIASTIYQKPQPELPYGDLNVFKEKLDELEFIAKEVEDNSATAEIKNDENSEAISRLKDRIKQIEDVNDANMDNLKEVGDNLKATNEKLVRLRKTVEEMDGFDFSDLEELKKRLYRFEEENPELESLVHRASEHVGKLKKMVDARIGMLNFTEDETKKIETSGVYNELVEGIEEAKDIVFAAKEILQGVLDMLDNPKDSDKLIDKTNVAHAKSDRLKRRISNMKNISDALNAKRRQVEDFKQTLIDSGKKNNELNRRLLNIDQRINMDQQLVDKLYEAMANSTKIIDRMGKLENDISDLNITVRYDLFNKRNAYLKSKEEASEEIKNARMNVDDAIRHVTQFLKNQQPIDEMGIQDGRVKLDSVSLKIKELQNKILYAKQAAESINVAMGLSNCSMLYSISQSEIFRSLAITFKCASCQLFKWGRGGMNIKIKNGKAILQFTNDEQESDEITTDKEGGVKLEKTLLVERIGSLIQMKFDNETSWNTAQIGNKVWIMDARDHFEVGNGLPSQNNSYIYKLSINDNNIGLWKFDKTTGRCKGQLRVYAKELDGANPYYSGNGYRMYESAPLTPAQFSLPFHFATFDENSLIYLAQENSFPQAFIALTLEDGHLRLDVHHSNNKHITIKTEEKFNDGETYSVNIAFRYNNKIQYYALNTMSRKYSEKEPLDNKAVFKIKKAIHYVGGIPPTLNSATLNVNTQSFLGFLSHPAQLSTERISSGVTPKVGKLELDKAWFNGNGSLHVISSLAPSEAAQKLESLSFILRPLNANAAILDIKNFGTVTLSNLLLQINLINGELYLADKRMALKTNNYNEISIRFKTNMISLSVDTEKEDIIRTKTDNIFKEDALEITIGYIEGFAPFYGGIGELSVNNEKLLITSKTVVGFSKVEIGRETPLIRPPAITLKGLDSSSTFVNMTNSMQNTQGCATTANYVTDPTAVNFGDLNDSYIKIKTSFWKKDFKMEFDFRTLYPNGMVFISVSSASPPQYHFLELKDGKLTFNVKGKRKIPKNWPITFPKKVNDGDWHSVKIVKKNGKKLQMWLDGESKKPIRMPKTAVKNELLLGYVPSDYINNYRDLKARIHPFRGCINNFKINEEIKLLGKNTNEVLYNNIRQCFPKIEEGAYFGGDAYAIYKEGFRINKNLELSFDFRTAEQNGILLTVSNEGNYPALSVELQNGAVVMTVDLGNGAQTSVANNLHSDFALCNNVWHNVTTMYTSSELTVTVDGIRKSWVQSDVNSLMHEIDAPLYIGGLPDNAAVGTLKTRENFKGCIGNFKIDQDLKEWSAMDELNNVLLNSCPLVSIAKH